MLVGLYSVGILVGGVYQVKIPEQNEMYQYLKNGVSAYSGGIIKGIGAVFSDNMPEFLVLFVSAYLPFGGYVVGGCLAVRGFMAGFAITAALRTYGLLGLVLCLGNVLSAATCAFIVAYGIFLFKGAEMSGRVKLGIFSFLYSLAVLGLDAVIKGGLSVVALRFFGKF
jgi:hypothetical protein